MKKILISAAVALLLSLKAMAMENPVDTSPSEVAPTLVIAPADPMWLQIGPDEHKDKIYASKDVVGLSTTLVNLQKDLPEMEREAQLEVLPLFSTGALPQNISVTKIKDFFVWLSWIALQVKEENSTANIEDQIKKDELVSLNQLSLKQICAYTVLAEYLDISWLASAFAARFANLIKKMNSLTERSQLALKIVNFSSDIAAEVAALLNVKNIIEEVWPVPSRELKGHTDSVNSVAFSPDGSQIVSGSYDKTVRIWDTHTGNLIKTLAGNADAVFSVAFSPDSSKIVSGSYDKTVRIWDTHTGNLIKTLAGDAGSVLSVAFSPDSSKIVSGSNDETVRIWDTHTGNLIKTLAGHTGSVLSVAFSPDRAGSHIVSGSHDKTVRIWDTHTGNLIKTLAGSTGSVNSVAFSPDGSQIVSGGFDKTIRIWDAHTGNLIKTLAGHTGRITSVAYSPNNSHIVSGSHDKTVRIWDTHTGNLIKTLADHTGSVLSVAFSPDNSHIVSGSHDKTVRIWQLIPKEISQSLKHPTLLQAAGILSWTEARRNNQPFDWHNYPEIVAEMLWLPKELRNFLGVKPRLVKDFKSRLIKLEEWEPEKKQD